ncbi:MAG: gamma-glutamylcyclotransferase family protein [Pseudomonadota bacterium]
MTYPYPREAGSFLFIDGGVYPYVTKTDRLLEDSKVSLPGGDVIEVSDLLDQLNLTRFRQQKFVPVVGYGSNAAPSQLSRKFAKEILETSVVIPVMKGWIDDYDVVWTPFFTSYGAMPSTIFPASGVRAELWLNWMPESILERMDATEGVGHYYVRTTLSEASFGFDGPNPERLELYVSCFGALEAQGTIQSLSAVPAEGRKTPEIDSSAALSLVQPTVAPQSSMLEMLRDTVSSPARRSRYTEALAPFRRFAESGPFSESACAHAGN